MNLQLPVYSDFLYSEKKLNIYKIHTTLTLYNVFTQCELHISTTTTTFN